MPNLFRFTLSPCRLVTLSLFLATLAPAADFTITRDPAGPALVGFGAQMNPYLYCTPNWGQVTEENVEDFEAKVIALRPQHVRIFFLQHWFEGRADVISKGDPKTAESFIRTCQLAQRAGATINLTNWYGPWVDPQNQMRAFAATLDELINQRKLTAIRFVTVQNEPNLHEDKISKEKYIALYRALDAALKDRQLRDKIQIVSGDLVQDNQQLWFKSIGENLADVSDGYSIHVYWDYWDTPKLRRRITEVPPIVAALPAGQERPLYVMEFGVRGRRKQPRLEPGNHDDGTPIAMKPLQAMQLAWFQMEALNRGYVGTVIWTLEDAWYDRLMPYGVIGNVKDGWLLKPGYHMLRLFTHTIQPGWRAMTMEGAKEGVIVSAARSPGEKQLTVLALNQGDTPQTLTIAGLKPAASLKQFLWNARGDGTITPGDLVQVDASGAVKLALSPLGLVALTSTSPRLEAP